MKDDKNNTFNLGTVSIQPQSPVVAGAWTTIGLTYTAGHPIDDTGYLKIVFRFAGDFGAPQFTDPSAPNYCTVSTTAQCRLDPRWDVKGHTRPWGRALFLKVMGGFVNEDDQITVIFGDTSSGSPGWQMQTFCEETFEFKTLVDPIATYQFKELPESPVLQIIPGDPVKAVCIAPSQVTINESFTYHLKLEDRWGNPTQLPVALQHPGFQEAGVETLGAEDGASGLSAISNPIEVLQASSDETTQNKKPRKWPRKRWWADWHGQSEETVGTNTVEDYFTFARYYGLVDITGHQGNDFQITDAFWRKINETTSSFNVPGSFVTFPGYEWSGNTPLGGDRNVFYTMEGGPISRSCGDLLPGGQTDFPHAPTAQALYDFLKSDTVSHNTFVVPHVGGRYADMTIHDPELEWNVEVHSAWGTFEWMIEDAIRMGYRVGICANSDGHKGRPGASYPGASKFGSYGGLTCVLADALDRETILEALQARHCYGTTGHRSLVDVSLNMGDGRSAMMGDIIEAGTEVPQLYIRVTGTGPIENIEIRNGLETITTERPYGTDNLGRRIKVIWSGAEVRGRDRMVPWDGGLLTQNNTIQQAVPVNFWNANRPLSQNRPDQLTWQSVTTGGVAGAILTLEHDKKGTIEIETQQHQTSCLIENIGLEPNVWDCGGLKKQLAIYRLPEEPSSSTFACTVPIENLRPGDNPIYIRVMQEDGHMAWTSPIYITRS